MITLVALCAPLHLAAQGTRPFTPADWYRLTTLSAPAISPDGKMVAFTVTTVKEADNRRHQEVWVVPSAGGASMRYTAPGYESSNPRWSHDGRWLLFTSTRAGSRGRTWGLRMDQPGGEAMEIDSFPTGAAPDSRRFVVTSEPVPADTTRRSSDQYGAMQPMARPTFGSITQPLDPKRFDGRHVTEIRYKANGQGTRLGVAEVRHEGGRPAPRGLDASSRLLEGARQLAVCPEPRRVQHHRGALGREATGDGAADAAARPGHQGHLAVERSHLLGPFASPGTLAQARARDGEAPLSFSTVYAKFSGTPQPRRTAWDSPSRKTS
jgi:dipeptidyl aminopeptidase/acylaminoacyl peptidase